MLSMKVCLLNGCLVWIHPHLLLSTNRLIMNPLETSIYHPSLSCHIPLKCATFLAQSNHVLINLQIKGALKTISECIVHHKQIMICQHITHLGTSRSTSMRVPRSHIQNIKITLEILKKLERRRLPIIH